MLNCISSSVFIVHYSRLKFDEYSPFRLGAKLNKVKLPSCDKLLCETALIITLSMSTVIIKFLIYCFFICVKK